jgi:hypothetical protein
MKLNGFVGPAYQLPALKANCQRSVNWYPELDESGFPKDGQVAFLKSTPGYRKIFELGTGPIRLIHFDGLQNDDGTYLQLNRLFVVSGSSVFRLEYGSGGWDISELGSLNTSSGPVSAASITQDYGVTVFVDGSDENYVYHKTTSSAESFETFTAAGYVPVERATQVKWCQGFLVFIVENSNQFYVSQWNSLTVDPLDFATAEGNPDTIVGVEVLNNEICFLNGRSAEFWAVTGNDAFPLERLQGGFIEKGCVAPFSIAKSDDQITWLSQNGVGRGIVWSNKYGRLSTHAIEEMISGFENIEDARAYIYEDKGHTFYVINFEETTLAYDFKTKSWHERCYLNSGELERDRVECHAYFPNFGGHIGGDYENAKIYLFDDSYYSHDGADIKCLRASPHIAEGNKYIKFNSLEIQMRVGVGIDGDSSDPAADPQVMMRFSDDGGLTWSNERQESAGRIGEYKKRVRFLQLGLSRDRVFEISMTAQVAKTLLSAEVDAVMAAR